MKKLVIVAVFVALSLHAVQVVELPQLPEGVLPNSESVTNVALGVGLDRLRSLSFAIALDAISR